MTSTNSATSKKEQLKDSIINNALNFWNSWQKPIQQSKLLKPFYPSISRLGMTGQAVIQELEKERRIVTSMTPKSGKPYVFPIAAKAVLGSEGILQAMLNEEI